MTVLFRQVFVYDAAAADGMVGPVDVLVSGDRIDVIGVDLPIPSGARTVEGGSRKLLVPGLINAHFHSPANHLKGSVRSLPLELFMLFESPADPALTPSPREAYLRTMLGAIEMLQRGITCVQDDAFLMPFPAPDVIDAVASAYRDSGMRAFLALDQPELAEAEKLPFLRDLDPATRQAFEVAAPAPAAQLLEAYDHLIGTWHGAADDRIRAAVSISAPQRVSLEYFSALDDLAERHGLPLYAHMLETKVQRTLMTEQTRFAGRSLVQYTAAAGLLKPHTNVIHAVWVDDADLDAIAAAAWAGVTLSTHLGNALPQPQPKFLNPLMAQLAEDALHASFIADGIHIPRHALRVLLRAKTAARSILVTDATAAAAAPPGLYRFAGMTIEHAPDGSVRVPGGTTLAGSALCLDQAVRNLVAWGLADAATALAMASTHPNALLAPALAHHRIALPDTTVGWTADLHPTGGA
ncbi:MAG: 5-methylthioadenosine/S-adenosylhomocysteine deaminase [Acetobacteraceae bacterium]|nr:5-methylthioadenosine/S-adenosylhomocysteine deaminase [Acetobacteraceae bacterium]